VRGLTGRIDGWMFGAYRAAPADLALYRIGYAVYLLLAVVPTALWVDRAPRAFFSPPAGLAALARDYPPAGVLPALNLLLVALLVLLLAGWRTAWVSAGTGVVLLAIKTWEYAGGKINHDILLVLVPLLLAGSGWGRALGWDARRTAGADPLRPRASWPLALLAFVTAMAMFGAGALKLMTGWLDPATHATYGHLVVNDMGAGRGTWLSARALAWDAPLVWEAADWAATLLETGFVLALLRQRWMNAALALACIFHLSVWLLFDIVFSANVLAYGAFVAWTRVVPRSAERIAAWTPSRRVALAAGCAAGAAGLAGMAAGAPLEHVLGLQLQELLIVAGAAGGVAYLARRLAGGGPTDGVPAGGAARDPG
jgi:hypothetical protein